MKIKLWLATSDGQDGSFNVDLYNTKEEALESLDRTEQEVKKGSFYEDGIIEQIELDIDEEGRLNEPFSINIE